MAVDNGGERDPDDPSKADGEKGKLVRSDNSDLPDKQSSRKRKRLVSEPYHHEEHKLNEKVICLIFFLESLSLLHCCYLMDLKYQN